MSMFQPQCIVVVAYRPYPHPRIASLIGILSEGGLTATRRLQNRLSHWKVTGILRTAFSQSKRTNFRSSGLILSYNGMLVPVRSTMYQRKVDVDNMLNAVKSVLTDVSSVSFSSEQRALCGVQPSTSTVR